MASCQFGAKPLLELILTGDIIAHFHLCPSGAQASRTIISSHRNFTVSTVPDDGLAPLGARPSAGTEMNNFEWEKICFLPAHKASGTYFPSDCT